MSTQTVEAPSAASRIARYGYRDSESILFVEFKDGAKYEYDKVPAEIFEEMQKAESVGSFLHNRVKGYYDARKVS